MKLMHVYLIKNDNIIQTNILRKFAIFSIIFMELVEIKTILGQLFFHGQNHYFEVDFVNIQTEISK